MKRKLTLMDRLLALNVAAIMIFGCRYLYLTNLKRQEEHKQAQTTASILTNMGMMNATDAMRFEELSQGSEHGDSISDTDFEWCLNEFNRQDVPADTILSRRVMFGGVFSGVASSLDVREKEKLFRAMVAELALDDPKSEAGADITSPACVFGRLGDKRAIPILESHLDDSRPLVREVVQRELSRLEGKVIR